MISVNKTLEMDESSLLLRTAHPESCLFFDIETTGFKASSSHLYLIGLAVPSPQEKTWVISQFLAEKPTEEAALLRAFARCMNDYSSVITFNGERFDIPYLREKYAKYGLEDPFAGKTTIDIYKDIRSYRAFLGLSHMNQKSLEHFLGLKREDTYNGGALIPVYRRFVSTGDVALRELLLLHNAEDVSGMLILTKLYAYPAALHHAPRANTAAIHVVDLSAANMPLGLDCGVLIRDAMDKKYAANKHASSDVDTLQDSHKSSYSECDIHSMQLHFPLSTPVPVPVCWKNDFFSLQLVQTEGILNVSALRGRLYYFFDHYQDYYYLPAEDQAIHKDVAIYVDKAHRQKATARNCYMPKDGVFLPQPVPHFSPALRRSYDDPLYWFAVPDDFPASADQDVLCEYVALLLETVKP